MNRIERMLFWLVCAVVLVRDSFPALADAWDLVRYTGWGFVAALGALGAVFLLAAFYHRQAED